MQNSNTFGLAAKDGVTCVDKASSVLYVAAVFRVVWVERACHKRPRAVETQSKHSKIVGK